MRRLVAVLALATALAPGIALAQAAPAPNVHPSANWAGYVAGNAYYSGVSALIQTPTPAAASPPGVVASWVGIGNAPNDVIQAGVEQIISVDGLITHAWYELLPQPSRSVVLDVQPGAWVLIDIRELEFNLWQITLVNGPSVFQRQVQYASSHSTAEWIVERPELGRGRLLPLATVTGANFANMSAVANGVTAIPAQLYPQAWGIASALSGNVRVAPSPLGPDGASFGVTTA
jgi:hypothetical protein